MNRRFKYLAVFALSLMLIKKIEAQSTESLYREIAHMDSVLFDAFNKRDIKKFETLFTKDLEFYHDKGGLTGYDHTIEFMKTTALNNNGLKRELIPGSMEVYPVKDYGAIQIGSHRFCHDENGKQECGTFRFIHVWKKENGEWKISRVLSFDH
ncbi:MAG: nuclear transport factor 2 family protein [Chitinophagaceae bacterium]|nr:nuclear transport factor 2 family protein [Chitinophagaceae bacterium]